MHEAIKIMKEELEKYKHDSEIYLKSLSNFKSKMQIVQFSNVSHGEQIMDIMTASLHELETEIKERVRRYEGIIRFIQENIDFSDYVKCDYCGDFCQKTNIEQAPSPHEDKRICDECYDDYFFQCETCKKEFLIDYIGFEHDDKQFCKDCVNKFQHRTKKGHDLS